MDPNTLSNLDPKLKETYDRVMGTTSPATANPAASADPASTLSQPVIDTQSKDLSSENTIPANNPSLAPSENISALSDEPHPQTVTLSQPAENPIASNIIAKPHGHMGLIRVFYILGGTVFFVIYIFFWAKIFNIKLPF